MERIEVLVDGKVLFHGDYKQLAVTGMRGKEIKSKTMKKGRKEILKEFARTIKEGDDWQVPLW